MKFLSKRNKPIEAKAEHTQAVFAVDDLAALVADQFDKAQRLESKVNSLEKEAVSLEKVEQERDAAVISANRSKREDSCGWCRYNPPVTVWAGRYAYANNGMVTRFPRVDKSAWCGKWEGR